MVFLFLVSVLFQRPLTFIIAEGGVGGRGGIEMASAKHNQIMSLQGPHFSPHTNDKSTNLRKNDIIGISDVVTASVNSEKIRLKKCMMITIIISMIMNLSQDTTFFGGGQKLTSAMKQRPEKYGKFDALQYTGKSS